MAGAERSREGRNPGMTTAADYSVKLPNNVSVHVGRDGWARFGFVPMRDYRWGIFLAERAPGRMIAFGEHKGEPAWDKVPGEYRADLRRLIVVQGDTEPASVEQQRNLGATAPSLYDL